MVVQKFYPWMIALMASGGVATLHSALADPELYGGLALTISQRPESFGELRFRFGPVVRVQESVIEAEASFQFELAEDGRLRQMLVNPSVSVDAPLARLAYEPAFAILQPNAPTVVLQREDGYLPTVAGVGFQDVQNAVAQAGAAFSRGRPLPGFDPETVEAFRIARALAREEEERSSLTDEIVSRLNGYLTPEGDRFRLRFLSDRSSPRVVYFPELELRLDPAFLPASSGAPGAPLDPGATEAR
jgi:hypothetical protein